MVVLSTNIIVGWGGRVEFGDSQVLVDPFDPIFLFKRRKTNF